MWPTGSWLHKNQCLLRENWVDSVEWLFKRCLLQSAFIHSLMPHWEPTMWYHKYSNEEVLGCTCKRRSQGEKNHCVPGKVLVFRLGSFWGLQCHGRNNQWITIWTHVIMSISDEYHKRRSRAKSQRRMRRHTEVHPYFSNINLHRNHLGIIIKCGLWFFYFL